MVVTGRISVKNENVGNEKFQKSELVIETAEQYPQSILVEFGGNKSELVKDYVVGQEVEVDINLRGRKWTNAEGVDKYFNTISGWKIKKLSESKEQQKEVVEVAESDLPF